MCFPLFLNSFSIFFKLWLILNGVIPNLWTQSDTFILEDWYGNKISLPTTTTMSLMFSTANMIKAVISFNVLRIHINVSEIPLGV